LTTVEGIIDRTISNLEADVEIKKEVDADLAEKIKLFAQKLADLKEFKLGEFEIVRKEIFLFFFWNTVFLFTFKRFWTIQVATVSLRIRMHQTKIRT